MATPSVITEASHAFILTTPKSTNSVSRGRTAKIEVRPSEWPTGSSTCLYMSPPFATRPARIPRGLATQRQGRVCLPLAARAMRGRPPATSGRALLRRDRDDRVQPRDLEYSANLGRKGRTHGERGVVLAAEAECGDDRVETGGVDECDGRKVEHYLVAGDDLATQLLRERGRGRKVELPLDLDPHKTVTVRMDVYREWCW